MERLDKILSNMGYGSRKEIKLAAKKGIIMVNGFTVKDSGMNVDAISDEICINSERIQYKKYIYLLMNKPPEVISATYDDRETTVIDLLPEKFKAFEPFPVGRLDKDTVGLLMLTNDGELNHRLIAPKKHVDKVYYAKINKPVGESDVEAFKNGIILDDGYKCLPGKLQVLKSDDSYSEVLVTIMEGKFHQVKRMFIALDKEVIYLQRQKFGTLVLSDINEGEVRELTDEELNSLKSLVNLE